MSDISTSDAGTSDASDQTDTGEPDTGDQGADLAAELEKWKAQARKHEERAKANATAAKELEKFRQQTMSDTEKAIEQARNEGRQRTLVEVGGKLAAAEVRAAATGRMSEEQIDTLLEGLNLSRFVGDDGEIDRAAVVKFVDGIAPQPTEQSATSVVDLGQGTRGVGQNAALNGDPLLRDLKAKLGIS